MVDKQVCNLNIVDTGTSYRSSSHMALTHCLTITAGQDEYKSLRSSYMRSCEGFVLVFDMTDKRSREGLQEYVGDIRRAKDSDHFPVVLCGNKSDLVDLHAEKIIEHADSFRRQFLNNCPFFETSAKERVNIDETFSELVRRVRQVKQKNAPATQPTSQKKGLFSSLSESHDSKKDLDQFKNL